MKIHDSYIKELEQIIQDFTCFCLINSPGRINSQLDTILGSRGPSSSLRRKAILHKQLSHCDSEVFCKLGAGAKNK